MEIRIYRDRRGVSPFEQWLAHLRDERARSRVLVQLDRLSLGLPGDWKPVGGGVFELRIFEGKGYRIYLARETDAVAILLCGGGKDTQNRDIRLAREYWLAHRRRS